MKKICFIFFIMVLSTQLYSQDFTQNFDNGDNIKDYFSKSPEATSKNKFHSMVMQENVTASIVNGKLRFFRKFSSANNAGSWVIGGTTSPLKPAANIVKISMEFEIVENSDGDQRMFLGIGRNIGDPPLPTANPNTHSSFVIKTLANSKEFTINNGTNMSAFKGKPVGPFSGKVVLEWIVNNSGNLYTYTGPDGKSNSVANDAWDLYVKKELVLDDELAITPTIENLTGLKFAFKTNDIGSVTADMDNISVQKLD